MWYRTKISRDIFTPNGKMKHITEYYLSDVENFAEAGYKALKHVGGEAEVEDVCLMKAYKPAGNVQYAETNKVFIVKFAEDYRSSDGTIRTVKYPVPFWANNNAELQTILALYMKQGLDNMRVTTVSETQWKII